MTFNFSSTLDASSTHPIATVKASNSVKDFLFQSVARNSNIMYIHDTVVLLKSGFVPVKKAMKYTFASSHNNLWKFQ